MSYQWTGTEYKKMGTLNNNWVKEGFEENRRLTPQARKMGSDLLIPIVTYASETWMLKENIVEKLLVFERKILRGIFGPMKENQIWRIKNNEELDKLIKHENILNYIKAQRLSWFGHVQRMPETREAKKIFKWNPLTTRPRGRPKYRWEVKCRSKMG